MVRPGKPKDAGGQGWNKSPAGKLGPTGTPSLCLRWWDGQVAKDWGWMKRTQGKVLWSSEGARPALLV